jgi:prepilin-type N-terminal cleavage/methylation domain-containing protein
MIPERKYRFAQSEAGFTLLEMLIAVTLVAMMAVSLWAVFRTSLRSWSRGTEFIDVNQRHRSILDLVRKQIASAFGLYAQADLQLGLPSTLYFSGTENSLRFVSLNSMRFHESPGLTLVIYEVAQDANGDFSLVEKEARYLGQISDQEAAASQAKPTPIFDNLSSCIFKYFDAGDSETSSEWVGEWNGEQLGRLPKAVSISMISRDPKGNALSRYMVVPLQAEANELRMNFINPFGRRRAVAQ